MATIRTTRSGTKRAASPSAAHSSPRSGKAMHSSHKRMKQDNSLHNKSSGDSLSGYDAQHASGTFESLELREEIGDIFSAPPNTLIIHACNCDGSWGAGIAKAFKDRYPKAFEEYADHCDEYGPSLLDSAQLIPPVDTDDAIQTKMHRDRDKEAQSGPSSKAKADPKDPHNPKHFVGCLFTSRHYGRRKDKPARILEATKPAMEMLLEQVKDWNAQHKKHDQVKEVRMCKINSGLFAVPWEKTKDVLEGIDISQSEVKVIKVVSPN